MSDQTPPESEGTPAQDNEQQAVETETHKEVVEETRTEVTPQDPSSSENSEDNN